MLGKDGYSQVKSSSSESGATESSETEVPSTPTSSSGTMLDNDYLITSLSLSRELGFIVGIAMPDCGANSKSKSNNKKSNQQQAQSSYLFTYNLKGNLVKSIEINGNLKDKDNILMQTTKDGEYIILTENSNTIKILRTFDLTPLYVLNTGEAPANFATEKICSLNLVELKYLLVGMENGKLLIYNIDFNRWNHESNNRY